MDLSSVITQISRPSSEQPPVDAANNHAGAAATTIPSVATSPAESSVGNSVGEENDAAAAAVLSQSTQKEPKKRSRRNFLCSIICCLGKKRSSHRSKSASSRDHHGARDHSDGGGGGVSGSTTAAAAAAVQPAAKSKHLLPEARPEDVAKKCIVIDLDETLVHSSFKPISNADFIVPVEIDGTIHQVYVLKRPHVDEFLCRMGELYECVLFTASLAKYADPVADLLDKWDVFRSRLFRESCVFHKNNYVKDLGRLGRELHKIIIVDNSPASYIFHPDNAVPVSSWFDDMNDRELLDLIPFLENLSKVDSVYGLLATKFRANGSSNSNNPA